MASASASALALASTLAFVITSEILGAGVIFSIFTEDLFCEGSVLSITGLNFIGGGAGGTESLLVSALFCDSFIIIFSADFKS